MEGNNALSIEERVIHLVNGNLNNVKPNIGKEYIAYRKESGVPERRAALELFTPEGIEPLIKFFKKQYDLSIKIDGTYSEYDSYLEYTYFNKPVFSENNTPFFLLDISGIFNKYLVIHSLVSPYSGNCNGQRALANFLKRFYGIPVIIQAGFLLAGDYDTFYKTDDFSYIAKLVQIYEDLGFINVNNKIGNYEESVIMINTNGCSEAALTRFNKIVGNVQKMDAFN